jgi:serine/threonine-protein kinase RIM15
MWMIRPYIVREVTIDLPAVLVEALGVGAEMLARYLTTLAEDGVTDASSYPRPPPVLCRMCERQITSWWFEKHTELCLQEHTAERDVQFAQETLMDHRKHIVKVLDALESQIRQPRAPSIDTPPTPLPEYNGLVIGTTLTPPTSLSGRSSPASAQSRSRERPATGFGHHRARSFAVRRPLPRIVELVLDLCDTAIEINMPAVKDIPGQIEGEVRTQSPGSESRISQVTQWHSPTIGTVEQEQGLAALCADTAKLARAKVDAVMRYRGVLEYSERIRVEFEILVQECIEAAVAKAASIAAGELSDSTEDVSDCPNDEQMAESQFQEPPPVEDNIFPCSLEAPSAISLALRSIDRQSTFASDAPSSTAASTRSSSPRGTGSRTPRSHADPIAPIPLNKRYSMHLESDAGMDSDCSVPSVTVRSNRADSPGSELGLTRVTSSRDRNKRRSLILPSVKTSRQHSPARSMPPPQSPLRMAKTRIPSGSEVSQSPMTSPIMLQNEFSSPASSMQYIQQIHRRQSSAASSMILERPTSPRLAPVSSNPQPQPRASPLSIKDFEMIKPISKGAFGSVHLAKKKATGEYFAIKALKKADMIAKNQVTNVKAERAIMMWQGESDFVAKLYWTFSSKDHLFLVMEYLNGGDCASLLKSLGGLPEEWSKRYLAEVVLGVEHLHSRGIVHRDLKPDNLLIDQKGHLKLTDFGLSRMGIVGRQKRAANSTGEDPHVPDLLKQSSIHRAVSMGSSRSASFDYHGQLSGSPSQTPSLVPTVDAPNPSYFSLHKEPSRRPSMRSDSETSETLSKMFKSFSVSEQDLIHSQASIEEESSGSAGQNSPDPYPSHSHTGSMGGSISTPPIANSGILMPGNLALFDPEDTSRKFVGTPDYLAPETISGVGQDELSDWWSLGCIMFEFLYGYPPFHADTPEEVFQNILARKIDWPPEELDDVTPQAKDLMNTLMCIDPSQRLGSNNEDKFASGGEEIKNHAWFVNINWETLRDDEAQFVPAAEDPENTEYFDPRGAVLQNFSTEFDETVPSPGNTPGAEYPDRPHDALSRVRSQVNSSTNSLKRGLIPLHIPPHVRDGRSRRLSEPVPTDDFGNFNFKNLPVLEKANKDVIQKLKAEAMEGKSKPNPGLSSPASVSSPSPSLDSSPIMPMPLKRALSSSKGSNRPSSPLLYTQPTCSPSRVSQPSSPLLVQFSTGQHHERRKTSSSSSSLSQQTSSSLQPGSFFDIPRLPGNLKTGSSASSPIKLSKSPGGPISAPDQHVRHPSATRVISNPTSKVVSPRGRSHTISSQASQESEDVVKDMKVNAKNRRSQVVDVSPSSSDNEDTRQKALLRVQRRRQSSRRLSQITLQEGPMFRPLDILICEDHPVSRLVMEKLLEKLRCRTVTAANGTEAVRFATGEVKFDIILTEYKLPNFTGADLAKMIRRTRNVNSNTPVVAVTGYLAELPPSHFFDGLIEKPPTTTKLTEVLGRLCQWRPPPPPPTASSMPLSWPIANGIPGMRQISNEDSPTSFTSSFGLIAGGSYRDSSREESISSSFFGELDSRPDDGLEVNNLNKTVSDDWGESQLARNFEGLGISSEDGQIDTRVEDPGPFSPGTLGPTGPFKRPTERIGLKKKRSSDGRRASADSGDDEDEELGRMRSKSPRSNRPRGSSKLGTEMMRTNSRGSVISVEDISSHDHLVKSPPPAIAEVPTAEEQKESTTPFLATTPPEQHLKPGSTFDGGSTPPSSGDSADATPRPQHVSNPMDQDDPTPRPASRTLAPKVEQPFEDIDYKN